MKEKIAIIKNNSFIDVEFCSKDLIDFDFGLPGFESLWRFALLKFKEYPQFALLQSLEEPDVSMILINAKILKIWNKIDIPITEIHKIGSESINNIEVFVVLKINGNANQFVGNVRAPIIINLNKKRGLQVISENDNLPMEYSLEGGIDYSKCCYPNNT